MQQLQQVTQVDPLRLFADLQDAQLIIGQQQIALLRMEQLLSQAQARIGELEALVAPTDEPTGEDGG